MLHPAWLRLALADAVSLEPLLKGLTTANS